MRLLKSDIYNDRIDSYDLVLDTFEGQSLPSYAILSHTWETEEVLLTHVVSGTATTRRGFGKLKYAADQARKDGFSYIWVDTCCIDKSSSAELSEAINSMYNWYENAEVCYAYLADVSSKVDLQAKVSEFTRSKWFTRGWCLQELIAPSRLEFFSGDWTIIGSKYTLRYQISSITKIDPEILTGDRPLETTSVATRMSWAAFRQTTRLEDIAYCLMGIFSVNMPMLYGEGIKAFHRLQEEILKHSDDRSIFAWVDFNSSPDSSHGLLADSPAAFANSAGIVPRSDGTERQPFEITNRGLRIDVNLTKWDTDTSVAVIECLSPLNGYKDPLAIWLKKLNPGGNQYARIRCETFASLNDVGPPVTIYVQQRVLDEPRYHHICLFQLRKIDDIITGYDVIGTRFLKPEISEATYLYCSRVVSEMESLGMPRTFQIAKAPGQLSAAIVLMRKSDGETLLLMLGSLKGHGVGFSAVPYSDCFLGDLNELQALFQPRPAGRPIILEYHRVRFDVKSRVEVGVKIYSVDISIESVVEKSQPMVILSGLTKEAKGISKKKEILNFLQKKR